MQRVFRNSVVSSCARTMIRGGSSHHHVPMMPPMAQLPTPTSRMHEETELMWDDGVAPETCIDFDAPHVSNAQALAWWLGGLGFFVVVYNAVKYSNPEAKRVALPRISTLPPTAFDPHDIFTGKRGVMASQTLHEDS